METNSLKNGIFSFIIPGLGQYLNGDKKTGLGLFAGAVVLHIFIWFFMNNSIGSIVQTLYPRMHILYTIFPDLSSPILR